jgi:hypothetical protein
MSKLIAMLFAIVISCPLIESTAGGARDVAESIHKVYAHEQALEHHHHHRFLVNFESVSSEASHQHTDDNSHSPTCISNCSAFVGLQSVIAFRSSTLDSHPSVILEGLLRPPQKLVFLITAAAVFENAT